MGTPNRVTCESAAMATEVMPAAVPAEAVTSTMTMASATMAAPAPSSMAAALGDGIA